MSAGLFNGRPVFASISRTNWLGRLFCFAGRRSQVGVTAQCFSRDNGAGIQAVDLFLKDRVTVVPGRVFLELGRSCALVDRFTFFTRFDFRRFGSELFDSSLFRTGVDFRKEGASWKDVRFRLIGVLLRAHCVFVGNALTYLSRRLLKLVRIGARGKDIASVAVLTTRVLRLRRLAIVVRDVRLLLVVLVDVVLDVRFYYNLFVPGRLVRVDVGVCFGPLVKYGRVSHEVAWVRVKYLANMGDHYHARSFSGSSPRA